MSLAAALLSCALAAFMTFAGAPKLAGHPKTALMAQHLRVPTELLRFVGLTETVAAIGLLVGIFVTWSGVAAALVVVALMLGGAACHLRVKDGFAAAAPALVSAATAAGVVILHIAGN
ncbi:DoxX family protein [Streptomyces sp. AS58]|uniref:DoxX family protein n=1 Tax=Streptomyces sp. AS58 TaxID=1519489 RepID=UPI0006AF108D|nr:DoxX family protein [Streptomyces sp. AS58]